MRADALEALSAVPFILSGRETLTAKEWCFILSLDWGTPHGLTPTLALKILRLALEEGVIEERDGQLKMSRPISIRPLFFHGKKIDFSGLKDVQPYPLNFKVEVGREEMKKALQKQPQKTAAREIALPSSEATDKPEKSRKTRKEEKKEKEEERKFKQTTLFSEG